jgi:hypothetical protein
VVDLTAIFKSFVLGLVIGAALLLTAPAGAGLAEGALNVVVCGAVGLVIGAATEWLTSLLPIRIARTAVYFLVNNLIAVVITAIVTTALVAVNPAGVVDRGGLGSVVALVVAIVCVANLGDYLVYRRAQRRLHAFQATLAVTADDD